MRAEVVVAGLGAMGSAAAYHLARRGFRVVGLDRFAPPHDRGSSHGESRVIREAYFEHPAYVPFVRRAFEAWRELEAESGRTLFVRTGALMVGPGDSAVVRGAMESARLHDIPREILDAEEVRRRFPVFRPAPEMIALLESRAGVLAPEACIEAHLRGAQAAGATVEAGVEVLGWEEVAGGVRVRTTGGDRTADHLVLALGPWMAGDVARADLGLTVVRQVVHWFPPGPAGDPASAPGCPVTIWEHAPGEAFYTIPDLGRGFKVGLHHGGEPTTPDAVRRTVGREDVAPVERVVRRHVPGVRGAVVRSATCMYTNTRDQHFVIDRHPLSERVTIASACSGHGFKFASAVGGALADRIAGAAPGPGMDLFAWRAGR